jgi:ABC-type transport system involved in cytochrome bd biosynthesis fused ATPase/permease subunit
MAIKRFILLAILLVTMLVLSACDLFGTSRAEQEREYYEQQIEAIKKAQEIHRQQQEEYNQRLKEGLEKWSEAYGQWQEQQRQQQMQKLEPIGGAQTDNQS